MRRQEVINAIGPTIELSSAFKAVRFEVPYELQVTSRGIRLGSIVLRRTNRDPADFLISMSSLARMNLSWAKRIEAVRIFSLICVARLQTRSRLRVVLADAPKPAQATMLRLGFVRDGNSWSLANPSALIGLDHKARDVEALYSNFFAVPWNIFSSCDTDVVSYLDRVPRRDRSRTRVLDLGCGLGKNASLLEHLGFETYGIDIAEHAVRRCRTLTRHPARYRVGSATALPWKDGFFDYVLDIGCLHCVGGISNVRSAILEVRRVLKVGGVLYSRIFLPRTREFLQRLPFRARKIGLPTEAAAKLLSPHFSCVCKVRRTASYFACARQ